MNFLRSLERVDHQLSEPLFRLRVPLWVEFLWSFPGNLFGLPIFCLTVLPFVGCVLEGNVTSLHRFVATFLSIGMVTSWVMVLQGNMTVARLIYGSKLGALAPFLGILLLKVTSCPHQEHAFFNMCCWCWSVFPVAILKPVVARTRPCCRIQGGSKHQKHLSVLPRLFRHDANNSFPSGDTCGAMASMYIWIRLGPTLLACSMVAFSILGRMYWTAHHFFDAMAGATLALCASWTLHQTLGDFSAQWWDVAYAYTALAVAVVGTRKILKQKLVQSGTISTSD